MADGAETTVAGVTLRQFATIRAGLADGLPLGALLGLVKLQAAAWDAAEQAWDERILDAIEEDEPLADELEGAYAEARKLWICRTPPLDESLQAWLDFVRGVGAAPEPSAYLERAGLTAARMAWLHRAWSERIARNPDVRGEALRILAEPPQEPPVPRPEPARLCTEAATEDGDATLLDAGKPAALPFVEGEVAPMPPPPLATPLPRKPRPKDAPVRIDETRFLGDVKPENPLPLMWAGPEAEAPAPSVREPGAARIAVPSGLAAKVGGATPAPPSGWAAPSAPPSARLGELPAAKRGKLSETAWAPSAAPSAPLPFAKASPSPSFAAAPPAPQPVTPAEPRAPHPGTGTVMFDAPAAGAGVPFAGGAEKDEETVGLRVSTGTVLALADALGGESLYRPALTVEQHGRLCGALAATPAKAAEILAQFGITAEQKKAEDDHWQRAMMSDPVLRMAWMRALTTWKDAMGGSK